MAKFGSGGGGGGSGIKFGGASVAIKVAIISQAVGSQEQLQKLLFEEQAEAKMLLQLRQPNVITVYGLAIEVDDIALEIKVHTVLELCTGSLQDLIDKKQLTDQWRRKIELCSQMAAGMAYLHSKRIFHRDLKPAVSEPSAELFAQIR